MASIEFRGKIEKIYNMDDTLAFERIKVPAIKSNHCDMPAFRKHPKIGPYANSGMFKNIISRELKALGVGEYIRLDCVPANVNLDVAGFLAKVTIHVA